MHFLTGPHLFDTAGQWFQVAAVESDRSCLFSLSKNLIETGQIGGDNSASGCQALKEHQGETFKK